MAWASRLGSKPKAAPAAPKPTLAAKPAPAPAAPTAASIVGSKAGAHAPTTTTAAPTANGHSAATATTATVTPSATAAPIVAVSHSDTKTAPAPAAAAPVVAEVPAAVAVADAKDVKQRDSTSSTASDDAGAAATTAADDNDGSAGAAAAAAAVADSKSAAADDGVGEHPLEHSWTFLYETSRRAKSKSKAKPLTFAPERHEVMAITTVEQFWCLSDHIAAPSDLVGRDPNIKIDYLFFKTGVQPEWEHCVGGGQWQLAVGKSAEDIDEQWQFTLMSLIGNQFEDDAEILGAAIRLRPRGTRLELWTKNSSDDVTIARIGQAWKTRAEINKKIEYHSFESLAKKRDAPILEL